jgi:transposase
MQGARRLFGLLVLGTLEGATVNSGSLHSLAVLPERTKEAVRAFLVSIPPLIRARIGTICTDMWEVIKRCKHPAAG